MPEVYVRFQIKSDYELPRGIKPPQNAPALVKIALSDLEDGVFEPDSTLYWLQGNATGYEIGEPCPACDGSEPDCYECNGSGMIWG